MSSQQQSPRQSQNVSALPSAASTQSLVVPKISCDINEAKLLQDLRHSYVGVEKVSRLHDRDGEPISAIQVEFKSSAVVMNILKEKFILLNGKRYAVRPYFPPSNNRRVPNGESRASAYSPSCLTEERVTELFQQQQMQLEAMMNAFENKWNARISSLTTSSTNASVDQLVPIFRELTTVCQQFNEQNVQMQKKLDGIVNRVKDVQVKSNNDQTQRPWSQVPLQNGHSNKK